MTVITESATRGLHDVVALRAMFAPRSVAIVGVSERAGSFGQRAWGNMARYTGRLFAVNPRYERYDGRPCHASLAALPEVPDCVLLALPREQCEEALMQCARLGVGAVVLFASGYAETGKPERARDQERLADFARDAGVRLLGPNCMGYVNNALGIGLTFAPKLWPQAPSGDAIGLVSQSGAIAFALSEGAARGKSFSHVLTAGNAIDVDVADQIAYLAYDDHCRAIACVFEGLADPARLVEAGRIARRAGKPVVAFKIARSQEGAAAAVSHTASMAGSDAAYAAAFERAGIVVVDHLDHLLDTAAFFAKASSLAVAAPGVAVVSASGGLGISATDQAEFHGVPMPQPSAAALEVLGRAIPEFGSARNPCDLTAQVSNDIELLVTCAEAMLADPAYGAMIYPHPSAHDVATERLRRLDAVAARQGKINCVVWSTEWLQGPGAEDAERLQHTGLFRSMSACLHALRQRVWWQSDAAGADTRPAALPGAREQALRIVAAAGGATLTEGEGMQLLSAYGIPVVADRLCTSEAEAVAAAEAVGHPVVMKIVSRDVPHKTEAGGVKLDLRDTAAVRAAYRAILENTRRAVPAARIEGVVVQAMVPAGLELVVGARRDPLFGPLVLVGLGGVLVELLQDSAVRLAPVDRVEAKRMLFGLRGARLLQGFRGSEPVAMDRLCEIVERVSLLASELRDVVDEIDVNPLICAGDRIVAVDALVRLRPRGDR